MDLYQKLGVAKNADEATIKKAYRSLAKQLHPDKNKDNPKAADRFADITSAYDLLSDKTKRAQYDRGEIDEQGNPKAAFGYGGGGGGNPFRGGARPGGGAQGFEYGAGAGAGGADFSDLFENIFGANTGSAPRGGNPFGTGFGGAAGGAGPNPFGGRQQRAAPKGEDVAYRLAVSLDEALALKPQRITLSSGKTIDLKITADAVGGKPMRLAGQGEPGAGGTGDATVTLEVKPHRAFVRDGDDIRLDLPVRLDEAVLGASVRVPTPEGGALMLKVPAGSSSGKVLRVPGKGFHTAAGGRGALLVTLMIDVPADDAALKAFVEGWDSEKARDPRAGLV